MSEQLQAQDVEHDNRVVNPALSHELAIHMDPEMTSAAEVTKFAKKIGELVAEGDPHNIDAQNALSDTRIKAIYADAPSPEYAKNEVGIEAIRIERKTAAENGIMPEPARVPEHVDEAAAKVRADLEKRAEISAKIAQQNWDERREKRLAQDQDSAEHSEQIAA